MTTTRLRRISFKPHPDIPGVSISCLGDLFGEVSFDYTERNWFWAVYADPEEDLEVGALDTELGAKRACLRELRKAWANKVNAHRSKRDGHP